MSLELPEPFQKALDAQPGQPLRVVDPRTQDNYVVLRADLFERLNGLSQEETFDIREAYPLMDAVAASEGWDDPALDSYNELPSRGQP